MSFSTGFAGTAADSFYQGGTLSSLVPSVYTHALDGHPFLIDDALTGEGRFRHITIPLLKPQQDTGKLGEASINPNGLWRSSVESWNKGAGQVNYDLTDSDPSRFRTSKGVDPWTRWELSLLPDTTHLSTTSATNLGLAPTSTRLFWLDGTNVKYSDDGVNVTGTMTGSPGGAWLSITTDGYNVYATDGTNVYNWIRTATAVGSAWNTLDCDVVQWVKGRLMASKGSLVYNITSSSAPAAITVATGTVSTDFVWTGFAAGKSAIYAAGFQGDKSLIFRMAIKTDATGLDVAVQAAELPDGEIVRTIDSYLGQFVQIGTDQGFRLAESANTAGDLDLGALVETSSAVRCFEGQGSSVWYGLTNFDGTSTGLGRLSLSTLTDPDFRVPAYASDLMCTAQGNVLAVCTFLGKRVFTVSGSGVWIESSNLVSSGTMYGGWRSFGIPEPKVALLLDMRHASLPAGASVAASIALDGSTTYSPVLASATALETGEQVAVGELTAERFEVLYTLTRATVTTTGPTVTREVLSMNPTADTGFMIIAPFLLSEVDDVQGQPHRNVATEKMFFEDLRATRDVVTYQELSRSIPVSLEDFLWLPSDPTSDRSAYQGTMVCQLKVV